MIINNFMKRASVLSFALIECVNLVAMHQNSLQIFKEGSEDAVIQLYQKGAYGVNQQIQLEGDLIVTPVFQAATRNQLEVLRYLVEHKADFVSPVPEGNDEGKTPFYRAAASGFLEIVKFLCDQEGVNINAPLASGGGLGCTPLYIACQNGRLPVVEFLHKRGADIHAPMAVGLYKGITPLCSAIYNGQLAVVQYLVKNKVDFRSTMKDGIGKGLTPIEIAMKNNHMGIVKFLLSQGAFLDKIAIIKNGSQDDIIRLCKCCFDVYSEIQIGGGVTASLAYLAASRGQVELLKYLHLERGVDVNAPFSGGSNLTSQTPLYGAALHGQLATVKYLVEQAGARIDEALGWGPLKGRRPIDAAFEGGHQEIVQYLVGKGSKSIDGTDEIIRYGTEQDILRLFESGFDYKNAMVVVRQFLGDFPRAPISLAAFAASRGLLNVLKFLHNHGIDINAPLGEESGSMQGYTPLFIASYQGYVDVVKYLHEQGQDLEASLPDGKLKGMTPLLIAAKNGHVMLVNYLCNQGLNYEKSGVYRLNPLEVAKKHKQTKVVDYLQHIKDFGLFDLEDVQKKSLMICLDKGGGRELEAAKKGAFHAITGSLQLAIENKIAVIVSPWVLHNLFFIGATELIASAESDLVEYSETASYKGSGAKAFFAISSLKADWSLFLNPERDFFVLLPNKYAQPGDYGFSEKLVPIAYDALIKSIRTVPSIADTINVDNLCALFVENVAQLSRVYLTGHSGGGMVAQLAFQDFIKFVECMRNKVEFLCIGGCYVAGAPMLELQRSLLKQSNDAISRIPLSALEKEHLKVVTSIHDWQQLMNQVSMYTGKESLLFLQKSLHELNVRKEAIELQLNLLRAEPPSKANLADIEFPIVIEGTAESYTYQSSGVYTLFINLERYLTQNIFPIKKRMTLAEVLKPLYQDADETNLANLPIVRFPGRYSFFRVLYELDPAVLPLTYTRVRAAHLTSLQGKITVKPEATIELKSRVQTVVVYPSNLSTTTLSCAGTQVPRFISAITGPAQHRIDTLIVPKGYTVLNAIHELFLRPLFQDAFELSPKLWLIRSLKTQDGVVLGEKLSVYTQEKKAAAMYRSGDVHYVLSEGEKEKGTLTTKVSLPLVLTGNNVRFEKTTDGDHELDELIIRTLPSEFALYEATAGHEMVSDILPLLEERVRQQIVK